MTEEAKRTRKANNFQAAVPDAVLTRFRKARDARGWTNAQYLERLLDLHEAVREWLDSEHQIPTRADEELSLYVVELGLGTVTA